jgi:hypothetical protein
LIRSNHYERKIQDAQVRAQADGWQPLSVEKTTLSLSTILKKRTMSTSGVGWFNGTRLQLNDPGVGGTAHYRKIK